MNEQERDNSIHIMFLEIAEKYKELNELFEELAFLILPDDEDAKGGEHENSD